MHAKRLPAVGSLPQKDMKTGERTPEEAKLFERGIGLMAALCNAAGTGTRDLFRPHMLHLLRTRLSPLASPIGRCFVGGDVRDPADEYTVATPWGGV